MQELSPADLKKKMEAEEIMLIDVRPEWEWEEDHISEKRILLQDLPGQIDTLAGWKNKPVVLYCNTGNNSAMGCRLLEDAGFEKVYHLEGGIEAWNARP